MYFSISITGCQPVFQGVWDLDSITYCPCRFRADFTVWLFCISPKEYWQATLAGFWVSLRAVFHNVLSYVCDEDANLHSVDHGGEEMADI
jgi:hypothetical protein